MRKIRIALVALLAAGVIAGLSRISFNVDILRLLPVHLKQVEGLSLFLRHFALPNELIITLEGKDAGAVEEAAASLAERLSEHSAQVRSVVHIPPWESSPQDLAELFAYLVLNQPPDKISGLLRRLSPVEAPVVAKESAEKLGDSLSPQEVAMLAYDPYGLGSSLADSRFVAQEAGSEFSSADGTFRVIYVEAAVPLGNYRETIAWVRRIKQLAHAGNEGRGVVLGFTGEPAFVADVSATMEWDMMSAAFMTLALIAAIFWLCYRRLRPLADLLMMLLTVFVISLGLAGLFLRELTMIGVGFASIMIGLSVDYGYLIYQRSLHHEGTLRALQWDSLQNIFWTAGTTSAAFFALNLSSLPGLSQLGNLVGIGVLVGAAVMILIFAPITQKWKKPPPGLSPAENLFQSEQFLRSGAWITAGLVAVFATVLLARGLPALDFSEQSLRPRQSGAYEALDRLYAKLAEDKAVLSLVVTGTSVEEVLSRLRTADARLQAAQARGEVTGFQTALPLWPDPPNQRANLPVLGGLAASSDRLAETLLSAGFTAEGFMLTRTVLEQWKTWERQAPPVWPENSASHWIFRRVASHGDGRFVAMGIVHPAQGAENPLIAAVQTDGVYLVSWSQLSQELRRVVPGEFVRLSLGLLVLLLAVLLLVFRDVRDVGLLMLGMALTFLSLLGAMSFLGLAWNLFNLAAILLLLGTGIDYPILMLLALRRNGGNVAAAQSSMGLVVGLCAACAAAGFGVIGWANNRGLASMGMTCALGLALDALISVFLLPRIWRFIQCGKKVILVNEWPVSPDPPR